MKKLAEFFVITKQEFPIIKRCCCAHCYEPRTERLGIRQTCCIVISDNKRRLLHILRRIKGGMVGYSTNRLYINSSHKAWIEVFLRSTPEHADGNGINLLCRFNLHAACSVDQNDKSNNIAPSILKNDQ